MSGYTIRRQVLTAETERTRFVIDLTLNQIHELRESGAELETELFSAPDSPPSFRLSLRNSEQFIEVRVQQLKYDRSYHLGSVRASFMVPDRSRRHETLLNKHGFTPIVDTETLFDQDNGLILNDTVTLQCSIYITDADFRVVDVDRYETIDAVYAKAQRDSLFTKLFINSEYRDVDILVEGEKHRQYKCVLGAGSTRFRQLFEENPETLQFNIHTQRSHTVESLMHYMYTGYVPTGRELSGLVRNMRSAANKLGIEFTGDETIETTLNAASTLSDECYCTVNRWSAETTTDMIRSKFTANVCIHWCEFKNMRDALLFGKNNQQHIRTTGEELRSPQGDLIVQLDCFTENRSFGLVPFNLFNDDNMKLVYYRGLLFDGDKQPVPELFFQQSVTGNGIEDRKSDNIIPIDRLVETMLSPQNSLFVLCEFYFTDELSAYIECWSPPPINDLITAETAVHLQQSLFTDVTIHVASHQLQAHRAVLAAESSIFKAMFDINKHSECRIDIVDIEIDIVKEMLTFLYTREPPNQKSKCVKLLIAAVKYNIEALKAVCQDQLTSCNVELIAGRCLISRQLYTDTVLVVGDCQFPAHRFMLASHSHVFKTMFESADTEHVAIVDLQADVVEALLIYLYTNQLPDRQKQEMLGYRLRDAAETYCIVQLQNTFHYQHIQSQYNYKSSSVDLKPDLLSDVIVSVKGRQFQAHRAVLCTQSTVFKVMLDKVVSITEGKTGTKISELTINDMEPDVMESAITFLYTSKLTNSDGTDGNTEQLLVAAERFKLNILKKLCEDILLTRITVDNVTAMLILGHSYDARRLVRTSKDFIRTHDEKVTGQTQWYDLAEDFPQLAQDTVRNISPEVHILNRKDIFDVCTD